jgi:hypothetical protein
MGYGIAAGFGKAGAAVGTQVFTPLRDSAGPSSTFYLAGGVGLLTSVIYFYLPEGRGVDLEREDEEFEKLVAEDGKWTLRENWKHGSLATVCIRCTQKESYIQSPWQLAGR